ncbi:MAG: hypothetical protein AVDCRST_MAG42-3215, partial [uncultured Chthoniobacterales bacterium]
GIRAAGSRAAAQAIRWGHRADRDRERSRAAACGAANLRRT